MEQYIMGRRKWNKGRIAIMVFVLLLIMIAAFLWTHRVSTITVEGNERLSDEKIISQLFSETTDRWAGKILWDRITNTKKSLAYIEDYKVEQVSLDAIKVTVYEKKLVGYIQYMGNYMLFDKDGIVMETLDTAPEDIPQITGLDFSYVLLNEELPIEDLSVFKDLLTVTQLISKYELPVEKINISRDYELTLYIGNVKIAVGRDDMLSEKISDLRDIIPNMDTETAGTLDMSDYNENGEYTFRSETKKNEKKSN